MGNFDAVMNGRVLEFGVGWRLFGASINGSMGDGKVYGV